MKVEFGTMAMELTGSGQVYAYRDGELVGVKTVDDDFGNDAFKAYATRVAATYGYSNSQMTFKS